MCNLLLIILFDFIEKMYFTKAAEDVFYYSAGLQSKYKRSISNTDLDSQFSSSHLIQKRVSSFSCNCIALLKTAQYLRSPISIHSSALCYV